MEWVTGQTSTATDRHQMECFEYLLVAQPGEQVQKKVNETGIYSGTYASTNEKRAVKPAIIMAGFKAKESMEETLIRWIQRICNLQKGFEVTLNNYGGHPPGTIYLRVQDHQPFRQLLQQLKKINEYLQWNDCLPMQINSRLFLTIASHYNEHTFNKVLLDYSQHEFHETFMLRELVLLKRRHQSGFRGISAGLMEDCVQVNVFGLYPPDTNNNAYVA